MPTDRGGVTPIRIGSESDIRAGLPDRTPTDERTNGQNGESDTRINHVTTPNAGARTNGFTGRTLAELIADDGKPRRSANPEAVAELTAVLANRNDSLSSTAPMLASLTREWADRYEFTDNQVRWPILRSGDRDPIPGLIRLSVYRRDDHICRECYRDMAHQRDEIELDHCMPWSAGGPDDSDNLRVLCRSCNQRRSNLIDLAHLRAYRPTTWWCFDCWSTDSHDDRHRMVWRNGIDLSQVLYVDDERVTTPPEQAFCAFCQRYSLTTHLLVGRRGRGLIAACEPRDRALLPTPDDDTDRTETDHEETPDE